MATRAVARRQSATGGTDAASSVRAHGGEIADRDLVGMYLDEIARTPLLDAAKEVELSQIIEAGVFARQVLDGYEESKADATREELEALVAESPRLLVQLPGADPSIALGPEQAAALLSDFMVQGEEVETLVRAAREVEAGRGYVELQRRYRVAGTQDVRQQSLLLGYRLGKEGWRLVELRVVG